MLNDRDELRRTYFTAWQKQQNHHPLNDVEKQIVAVLIDHPEYHHYFSDINHLHQEYIPEMDEVNPYLHLGLHIAIREQIQTNRPMGMLDVYAELMKKYGDHLLVEHKMIDCLAEAIWQMQRSGVEMDMQVYLEKLKKLI